MKIKNILMCSVIACSLTTVTGIVKESIDHEPIALAKTVSPSDSNKLLQDDIITLPLSKDDYENDVNEFIQSAQADKNDSNNSDDDMFTTSPEASGKDYMKDLKVLKNVEKNLNKTLKEDKSSLTKQDYKTLKQYYGLLKNYIDAGKQYGEDIDSNSDSDGSKANMDDAHTKWVNMYDKLTAGSAELQEYQQDKQQDNN